MLEKLDFLVRFWELRARYEQLGMPLSESERFELLSLLTLVATDEEAASVETIDTSRRGVPVQLTAGSGFLAGDLKQISSERLVVGAVYPLAAGERTVLYAADAISGVEYTVPCVVAWSREDEPSIIVLAPDGLPSRSHFVSPSSGLWRSPLRIGASSERVEA